MIDAFLILSSRGQLLFSRHFGPDGAVAGIDGHASNLEADVLRNLAGSSPECSGIREGRWSCFALGAAFVVYAGAGDLVFVVVGSGDDDELALYEVGRAVVDVVREHCGGRLDEEHVRELFGKVSLAIDEMLNGGFVEVLSKETVMRQSKLKPFKT